MSLKSAILGVTALAAALAAAAPAAAQDYNLDPNFGYLNIGAGFMPDPAVIPLWSGGGLDVSTTLPQCVGYISDAPDFRVNFEAGTGLPLTFAVQSEADTTLVINAADGSWHCIDDFDGLNPAITFQNPASGQYDIWIGTYGEPANYQAGLYITELAG